MAGSWSNLTASNFDGSTPHPDFSLSGGVIEFGFNNSNSATGVFRTTHSGFDNFSLTVNFTPIPEPSTHAVFAGLGALTLATWRRRRAGGA